MMNASAYHMFRVQSCRLTNALHQLFPSFQPETIHCFRVEYKKMRALMRLHQISGKTDQRVMPERLRHLYRSLGFIRELQLLQHHILARYSDRLVVIQPILNRMHQTVFSALLSFRKKQLLAMGEKSIQKLHRSYKHSMPEHAVQVFETDRLDRIRKRVQKPPVGDDTWHQVRKYLKDLLYVSKMNKLAGVKQMHVSPCIPQLEELTEQLGQQQDLVRCIEYLRLYLEINPEEPEATLLKCMLQESVEGNEKRKEDSMSRLDDFLLSTVH